MTKKAMLSISRHQDIDSSQVVTAKNQNLFITKRREKKKKGTKN